MNRLLYLTKTSLILPIFKLTNESSKKINQIISNFFPSVQGVFLWNHGHFSFYSESSAPHHIFLSPSLSFPAPFLPVFSWGNFTSQTLPLASLLTFHSTFRSSFNGRTHGPFLFLGLLLSFFLCTWSLQTCFFGAIFILIFIGLIEYLLDVYFPLILMIMTYFPWFSRRLNRIDTGRGRVIASFKSRRTLIIFFEFTFIIQNIRDFNVQKLTYLKSHTIKKITKNYDDVVIKINYNHRSHHPSTYGDLKLSHSNQINILFIVTKSDKLIEKFTLYIKETNEFVINWF